jgi:hypothetical protein
MAYRHIDVRNLYNKESNERKHKVFFINIHSRRILGFIQGAQRNSQVICQAKNIEWRNLIGSSGKRSFLLLS